MRFWFIPAFFGIPLCLIASTPRVVSVTFAGNTAFTQETLSSLITLKPGSAFSRTECDRDRDRIVASYRDAGWLSAAVTPESLIARPDSSGFAITYRISEGLRYTIDSIRVRGMTVFSEKEVVDGFRALRGAVFSQKLLEHAIDALIARYESVGYPFASVTVDTLSCTEHDLSGGVSIGLGVTEGKRITIDQIRITGNSQTSPDVIIRELRIAAHELYNEEKVKRIPALLMRTNLFLSVNEPELYYDSAEGGLLLTVREANTNTFDGIVGYAPARGGTASGFVHVALGNLFGTGRKMDVRWQREDESSQELHLFYSEPWIFGIPLGLSGGLTQRQQDSAYVRRTVEGRANLAFNETLLLSGFVTHTLVIPSSTLSIQPVRASRTVSFGLSLQYDTRNDPLSPTAGSFYGSAYLVGSKKQYGDLPTGVEASTGVQTITVDAEIYRTVFSRQIAVVGLHGRQTEGSRTGPEDYFRFGGAMTLRGYGENELTGTRVAWINTEYRFLLEQRSYLFGLFDLGFASLPGNATAGNGETNLLRFGYGLGFRIDSPLGYLGVILAFGQGDTFGQGKLHISLFNRF
jgi:outer membrane protein assembly factor BamA